MARWTDIADWVGPPAENFGDGDYAELETADRMYEVRGVVLHIEQGSDIGTTAWMENAASDVSSHFLSRKASARGGQMVDTADRAWTQADGNGHWLSIENEGWQGEALTPQQVEFCAQILAKAHVVYGVPLQITNDPNGRGLGWHGMGGAAWGGHYDCPGEPVKNQRQQIIDRAAQILNPLLVSEEERMYPQHIPTGAGERVVLLFPYADGDHPGFSIGTDTGASGRTKAAWRVAAHKVGAGWSVSAVITDSQDDRRKDVPLQAGTDRVSITRVPVDSTDPCDVPASALAWW